MVLFHQYVPDKIQGLLSSKIEDRLQRNHEFDQQNVDNHLLLKDCLNASAPTRKQDFKIVKNYNMVCSYSRIKCYEIKITICKI